MCDWVPWKIEKLVSKGEYTYAVVRDHPKASRHGYVLHHRIVMENMIGRLLLETEVVHHKNHDKKDCRPCNLKLETPSSHSRLHAIELGQIWVGLQCQECARLFTRTKSQTHLSKPSRYRATCCSKTCRGRFYQRIQQHGLSAQGKRDIRLNVRYMQRKFTS